MYKFTSGLVFFTKEDAIKAIQAGHKLIEKKVVEKPLLPYKDEECIIPLGVNDEESNVTDKFVSKANKSTKTTTRKNKKSI